MDVSASPLAVAGSRTVRSIHRAVGTFVLVLAGTAGLYLLSRTNYLLYHSLAELFSVVIAAGVFMIGWNARQYGEARPFVFLGVVYLSVAVLDTFHTLGYAGMQVFSGDHFYANEIWIGTRFIESVSLLLFLSIPGTLSRLSGQAYLGIFAAGTAALLVAIIPLDVFPAAYIDGEGQTLFKVIGELVVVAVLAAAIAVLYRRRNDFARSISRLIGASLALTMASELCFTLYQDNYGLMNYAGHVLKIASFICIYKALVESGIRKPFETIFRDLRDSRERLIQANAAKDRFFSIIAHDLKNPIHGIAELSRLALHARLRENAEKASVDGQSATHGQSSLEEEPLALILQSARSSADLLDKLLLWARSQTGRLRVEPYQFDLASVAAECKQLAAAQADEKGVILVNEVSPGTTVYADPNMVTTVLRNLLSNGVKFTGAAGVVRMRAEREGSSVTVSVRDTGMGMTTEELDDLFRIDTSRTKSGTAGESGTGLGLIICKEFVERNGGRIWASSSRGGGSVFKFTVPAGG